MKGITWQYLSEKSQKQQNAHAELYGTTKLKWHRFINVITVAKQKFSTTYALLAVNTTVALFLTSQNNRLKTDLKPLLGLFLFV